MRSCMNVKVRPLTPKLWPALEDLLGREGACHGCWCMYWRIGPAYRRRPAQTNKATFRQVVKQGPPPGLLAFHGDSAVGWCQLGPREDLTWLPHEWRLKPVDDVPVWSISCMYVRKTHRRRGVSAALITRCGERRQACRSAGTRSLPIRRECLRHFLQHRLCFSVRTRRVPHHSPHIPARPIMRYDLLRSRPHSGAFR